jgi:hypothetical protein
MMSWNIKILGVGLVLLVLTGWVVPKLTTSINDSHRNRVSEKTSGFLPDISWMKETLFQRTGEGFRLRYRDESGREVLFPRVLNTQTPVVFVNGNQRFQEYIPLGENREAKIVGGYLVYSGQEGSLYYWYDEQNHKLKKFVLSSNQPAL